MLLAVLLELELDDAEDDDVELLLLLELGDAVQLLLLLAL